MSGPTVVARLTASAEGARDLLDRLAEVFDASEAVVSAYDTGSGWAVAIHFNDPPNETAVRALVGLAAGPEAANALAFETLAAKDWVKASQEGLKPVEAGRFIVHSEHYRSAVRVEPHRHRDRDRVRLRHRTSRHHAGMPAGARPSSEVASPAPYPRYRHRDGRPRDCRRPGAAPPGAGERHRPTGGAGRARERQAQPRRHRDGRSCRRYRHAALSRPRAVRPRARQHPARAVAADGDADGAAARAGRPRRPLRTADVTGKRRARDLSA